jgi:hemoglobin
VNGSVFERLGGFARVRLLVSEFYEKVLDSEQLSVYFQHIDMRRLVDHQTKFISALMGGPASYSDEQIARAHVRLGIRSEDFAEMADLFRETLEDNRLEAVEVTRLHAHLLSLREFVVAEAHDAVT